MSSEHFTKAVARVLVYEGGKVDDPADPGGRTNQGVTQRTYDAWRRSQNLATRDVYTMANAERDAIYRHSYWDMVRGDALPVGVDLAVFDAAVNSGVGQAVKWLQSALGDHYTGQRDGVMGTKTLQAIQDFGEEGELVTEICSRRLATLKQLRTWSRFGKGWSARIANVQKTACSWIDSAPEPMLIDVSTVDGQRKAPVSGNLKEPVVSQLAAHVTTAATSAGALASQTAQQITALQDTFSWLKWVFGGLTLGAVVLGIVAKLSADAKDAADKGNATASVDPDADAGLPTATAPEVTSPPPAAQETPAAPAQGA